MPTTLDVADELITNLKREADPIRAVNEKRYLKSPENMQHIGVKVPVIRVHAKAYVKAHPEMSRADVVAIAEELWSQNVHEAKMLAIEILNAQSDLLVAEDTALIERLIDQSHTWAYVDNLSVHTMGNLLKRYPEETKVLDRWVVGENFWLRRAAMLALLVPLRSGSGDFQRFAGYAESMMEEKEFFIRKAIGWILRETSKKRPELAAEWLTRNAHRCSVLTVREATRYLPERQASLFIQAAKSGSPS